MNRAETLDLLTLAAAHDQRTIGETDVLAWHEVLRDIGAADAAAVVNAYYREPQPRRITPADVRRGVREIRDLRLARAGDEAPDGDPDDVQRYLAALAQRKAAIADGLAPAVALPPPAPPPTAITHRSGRDDRIVAALSVPCPWCKARRGERCTTPRTQRPLTHSPVHPSRLAAASKETA